MFKYECFVWFFRTMEFDQRLYVARGVPKLRGIAEQVVAQNTSFRFGQMDLLRRENGYIGRFLDTRTAKAVRNLSNKKGFEVIKLRDYGEKEYLVHAALTYGNLLSASEAHPDLRLSEITGLPIVLERDVSEYAEIYEIVRKRDGAISFVFKMAEVDRMLNEALDYRAEIVAEEANSIDTSNVNQIARFITNMSKRGEKEVYEMLARQNAFNLEKGRPNT